MIRGVFDISNEFDVILNPSAIKLCPGLKILNNNELLYVIYVYDYRDSPARNKPEEERKRNAIRRFFPDKEDNYQPEKTKKIEKAIQEYEMLIFDERLDSIQKLKKKKAMLMNSIEIEMNTTILSGLLRSVDLINKEIDKLDEEFKADEEMIHIKGNKTLSWLEEKIFNLRIRNYKSNRL